MVFEFFAPVHINQRSLWQPVVGSIIQIPSIDSGGIKTGEFSGYFLYLF